jgi:phage-related protein
MDGMQGTAQNARNGFDLVTGALNSLGQLGQVIGTGVLSDLGKNIGKNIGGLFTNMMPGVTKFLGGLDEKVTGVFGNIISKISGVLSGLSQGALGLIIEMFSRLMNVFSKLSGNANAVMNVFDTLFSVVEDIMSEMGPVLDVIFKPLLGIIQAFGRVLGAVMVLILPLVEIFMKIVDCFNVLTPILNTVAFFLALCADAFGLLYNAISDIIKAVTLNIVDIGHQATNNMQKVLSGIEQNNEFSQSSNNSTSYQVSGDLYIKIYYEHSYVNGDSQQIALNIRDEIRRAEGKGY